MGDPKRGYGMQRTPNIFSLEYLGPKEQTLENMQLCFDYLVISFL